MEKAPIIPIFTLLGETGYFSDVVHCEDLSVRAPHHGWKIPAHRHAGMAQLFLIDDGGMLAKVDDREQQVSSGTLLFVPARAVHALDIAPDTEGWVLSFPQNVVNTVGPSTAEVRLSLSQPFTAPFDPPLQALRRLMSDTRHGDGAFRAQVTLGLAHAMLAHLAQIVFDRKQDRIQPVSTRLAQLDVLIAENAHKGWGASEYAGALSVSTGHLSRLCRAASGMGATAYIERAVMEEACRLLAFSDVPVAEVGYRLGFNDPSYFSKRFRVVRQQSPSDFRSQHARKAMA